MQPGGTGGIGHYLSHLGPSQERRWQDLGNPALDRATQDKLIAAQLALSGQRP